MNFIPLESKRKCNFANSSTKKKRKAMPISFGGDNHILPRITQLIEVYKDSHFIDEDHLLSELQGIFPEYRRKKIGVLKAAIRKAITLFFEDTGNKSGNNSEHSCISDDKFSTNQRLAACVDAKLSKGKRLSEHQKYLVEEETSSIKDNYIQNVATDGSSHSPKDRKEKSLKNSTKGSNTKDPELEKFQKTQKIFGKRVPVPQYPTVKLCDVGGQENTLVEICKLLMRLKFPEIHSALGVNKSPCGVLLHGPPGSGKTLLAHAIAGELGFPLLEAASTELVSGISGDSEEKIRNLFEQAISSSPCILFIDEIDAITPKRDNAPKEMEKRIVSQLLKSMDELSTKNCRVLVIGATNRPDAIDPALRRGGRFDREISIGMPDEDQRIGILKVICKTLRLSPKFEYRWLAKSTPGAVGADLVALIAEAVDVAINRALQKMCSIHDSDNKVQMKEVDLEEKMIVNYGGESLAKKAEFEKLRSVLSVSDTEKGPLIEKLLEDLYIEVEDFQEALQTFVPCSKREGFAIVPTVTWNDVGALKSVQESLQLTILWPVKYREACQMFPKTARSSGVLLWGPKGCGKTLLAKAMANECSINFLSVKGPELLNMYVGESERAVRQVFQRARNSAPCVILFDELDALCPSRENSHGNAAAERVVNQLLTEMDGMEPRKQVYVMGTTNRIDKIDPAVMRPGRFDETIFVGLPTSEERIDILKAVTKNGTDPKLAADVSLEAIALDSRCDGFSGADLNYLIQKASSEALYDYVTKSKAGVEDVNAELSIKHFDRAFLKIKPSVSEEERNYFKKRKLQEDKKSKQTQC